MTPLHRARIIAASAPEGYSKYLFLNNIFITAALVLLCTLMTAAAHAQAPVARVLETKGTTLVERSGQMPRLLGAGETLSERDTVNVARDSWAIIEFNDQTRVSLRPNTVFRLDTYKPDAPEAMLLGLVKGGLRVVTGLFGKRNPQGVKVQTAVATIGIRGTEFDARLCADDCAAEEKAAPAPRPVVLPVARVVEINGVAAAGRAGETVRLLVPGAMLNEGDAVAVGRGGSVLLVFRDGARVSLVENSRFAINRFRFNEAQPREGSAFLTLYAGNALVTTGQLAKISPDAFLFRTALGVVRPFGTTFGGGGCIGSLCASGSVTVNSDGASASGSASGGGASASGSASAGAGGASASGEVNKPGGGGASGTLNLGPNTDFTQMAKTPAAPTSVPLPYPNLPSAAAVNEAVNGVQQVVNEVAGSAASQGRSAAEAARQRATETVAAGQDRLQTVAQNATVSAEGRASVAMGELRAILDRIKNLPDSPAGRAALAQARKDLAGISSELNAIAALSTDQQLRNEVLTMAALTAAVVAAPAVAALIIGAYVVDAVFVAELTIVKSTPALMIASAMLLESIGMHDAAAILRDAAALDQMGIMTDSAQVLLSMRALLLSLPATAGTEARQNIAGLLAKLEQDVAQLPAQTNAADAEVSRKKAAAEKVAAEAKAAADAKLAAARKEAEEKAAADQKMVEQKLAAAKAAAEAKSKEIAASGRSYDISGGVIAVVGPPDTVLPPGLLNTLPGEPQVAHVDGRVITTWVESMVPPYVTTAHGGVPVAGSVTRTEIVGPEGTTTTLTFNLTFTDPMVFPGPVPAVGGPLVALGPFKPGIVQVTHRAPDGTTTVSYPGNQNGESNPSSVAVLEGEVDVLGRGRLRAGEMLASSGSRVRMPALTKTSLARAGGDPFGGAEKAVEEGLYVWVRDGAVQVAKDNQAVDVGAGNAAVATKDSVRLLDVVPNFLRFDSTPRPFPALGETKVDAFRAADGALLNMCTVR